MGSPDQGSRISTLAIILLTTVTVGIFSHLTADSMINGSSRLLSSIKLHLPLISRSKCSSITEASAPVSFLPLLSTPVIENWTLYDVVLIWSERPARRCLLILYYCSSLSTCFCKSFSFVLSSSTWHSSMGWSPLHFSVHKHFFSRFLYHHSYVLFQLFSGDHPRIFKNFSPFDLVSLLKFPCRFLFSFSLPCYWSIYSWSMGAGSLNIIAAPFWVASFAKVYASVTNVELNSSPGKLVTSLASCLALPVRYGIFPSFLLTTSLFHVPFAA